MAGEETGQVKFGRLDEIKSFRERLEGERAERKLLGVRPLGFGVSFLDDALGGIYKNDVIVLGAKAGVGKTELAVQIACRVAEQGGSVHFFALEAERREIERRVKYRVVSELFFKTLRRRFASISMNYMDWYYGKLDEYVGEYEAEIDEILTTAYSSLHTFYRLHQDYRVEDFEKQFLAIKDETDLVIVDHLHYFDFDDENENRAMKSIVKKCRDLAQVTEKPVVLIAHLRKSDRRQKSLIPDLEDFHGSSDIGKIATKAVMLAPARMEILEEKTVTIPPPDPAEKNKFWATFMQIAKCRVDSSRTRPAALLKFNLDTHRYEPTYLLGDLSPDGSEWKPREPDRVPYWAKSAKR